MAHSTSAKRMAIKRIFFINVPLSVFDPTVSLPTHRADTGQSVGAELAAQPIQINGQRVGACGALAQNGVQLCLGHHTVTVLVKQCDQRRFGGA